MSGSVLPQEGFGSVDAYGGSSNESGSDELPAILRSQTFVAHLKQTVSGCFMNCITIVREQSEKAKCAHEAVLEFVADENRENALGLLRTLLSKYIQSLCDDYCATYFALFLAKDYSLKKAMGHTKASASFKNDAYSFRIFNTIFEESRRAREGDTTCVPGPLHLNCINELIFQHVAPLTFAEVLNLFPKDFVMGGSGKANAKGLSEAERNIIRAVVTEVIEQAIAVLGVKYRQQLAAMKFACVDDTCDKGWDWTSMPKSRQQEAREAAAQQWKKYREEMTSKAKGGEKGSDNSEDDEDDEDDEDEDEGESSEEEEGEDSDNSEEEGEDCSSDSDVDGNLRTDRVLNKRYRNYGTGEVYVYDEERIEQESRVRSRKAAKVSETILHSK